MSLPALVITHIRKTLLGHMTITQFGAHTKLKRRRILVHHRLDFLLATEDVITIVQVLIHMVALGKLTAPLYIYVFRAEGAIMPTRSRTMVRTASKCFLGWIAKTEVLAHFLQLTFFYHSQQFGILYLSRPHRIESERNSMTFIYMKKPLRNCFPRWH